MKKILFFATVLIFGLSTIQAQNSFYFGAHAGLPTSKGAGDMTSFALAADFGYLFDISENLEIGPTIGYSHTFGKEVDTGIGTSQVDDIQFMPIGAAGRYHISNEFSLGADLGFAIGISEENNGGFYYSPRAAYSLSNIMDIVLSYRGITGDTGSWNIVSLGLELSFD